MLSTTNDADSAALKSGNTPNSNNNQESYEFAQSVFENLQIPELQSKSLFYIFFGIWKNKNFIIDLQLFLKLSQQQQQNNLQIFENNESKNQQSIMETTSKHFFRFFFKLINFFIADSINNAFGNMLFKNSQVSVDFNASALNASSSTTYSSEAQSAPSSNSFTTTMNNVTLGKRKRLRRHPVWKFFRDVDQNLNNKVWVV